MLVRDLKVGDFVSYEVIYLRQRHKFICQVMSYFNGKAVIHAYLPNENALRKLSVRIVDLYPLDGMARQKLSALDWQSLEVRPIQAQNKIESLFGEMTAN